MKKIISNLLFYPVVDNRFNYSRQLYFQQIYKDFSSVDCERQEGNVVSISGSDELSMALGVNKEIIQDLKYPEHDCTNLFTLESSTVDLYVSDQVLEHIGINPSDKFTEANRVVKPGGVIVIATCFYNKLHMLPNDYMRYTEGALKELCVDQNWNIIHSGSFGTGGLAVLNILGGSGKGFRFTAKLLVKIINSVIGKSQSLYPLYTYVIAKKNTE